MTRVAYVVSDPGVPVFGRKGCSVHVREVLRAMLDLGMEVVLFARRFDGPQPAELERVSVCRLPSLPKGDGEARERAALDGNATLRAALERSGSFDLVYERYSLWSYGGMEYARSAGVSGLLEVNAPLIDEQTRYRTLVDREGAVATTDRTFRAASQLIAVSRGVADYLREFTGAPDRIHVIPNGVDPDRFPEGLPPSLPAAPSTFTVGFVGSLRPWHGLSVLVEAFSLLAENETALRLLVVGDGPERADLVSNLSGRGLLDAVHLAGSVPPDRVPGLLASMDAAVAPYPPQPRFYFSPLKVYEYMAAGLPVVASRIGQIEELIEPEVNGLLCSPGDARALAAALDRLRDDEALRLRLGRAARDSIRKEHSWTEVTRRLLALGRIGLPEVQRQEARAAP